MRLLLLAMPWLRANSVSQSTRKHRQWLLRPSQAHQQNISVADSCTTALLYYGNYVNHFYTYMYSIFCYRIQYRVFPSTMGEELITKADRVLSGTHLLHIAGTSRIHMRCTWKSCVNSPHSYLLPTMPLCTPLLRSTSRREFVM